MRSTTPNTKILSSGTVRAVKPMATVVMSKTTLAGALQSGINPLQDPWQMTAGLPFALTLMTILLVHEMGHYLACRYYGIRVTLPFFIPIPPIPLFVLLPGTMPLFVAVLSAVVAPAEPAGEGRLPPEDETCRVGAHELKLLRIDYRSPLEPLFVIEAALSATR